MKVCTDACIQGAFTARYLFDNDTAAPAILDIGAGTGLLSLMLAQRVNAAITAVELDPAAARQAAQNFAASPWANRLILTEQDIRKMDGSRAYDFIITNPPFYEGSLKSGHAQKDKAMHATDLGYKELIEAIDRQLAPGGEVSVLLPYAAFDIFSALALKSGYYLQQVLYIRQREGSGFFRSVGLFSKTAANPVVKELAVYDNGDVYTPGFAELLQPYYLYL